MNRYAQSTSWEVLRKEFDKWIEGNQIDAVEAVELWHSLIITEGPKVARQCFENLKKDYKAIYVECTYNPRVGQFEIMNCYGVLIDKAYTSQAFIALMKNKRYILVETDALLATLEHHTLDEVVEIIRALGIKTIQNSPISMQLL